MATVLSRKQPVKAPTTVIRSVTGFAIGRVSPFGHLKPIMTFFVIDLTKFPVIYDSSGILVLISGCIPRIMQRLCNGLISNLY